MEKHIIVVPEKSCIPLDKMEWACADIVYLSRPLLSQMLITAFNISKAEFKRKLGEGAIDVEGVRTKFDLELEPAIYNIRYGRHTLWLWHSDYRHRLRDYILYYWGKLERIMAWGRR